MAVFHSGHQRMDVRGHFFLVEYKKIRSLVCMSKYTYLEFAVRFDFLNNRVNLGTRTFSVIIKLDEICLQVIPQELPILSLMV
jgi:hypothetical protein